MQTLGHGLVLAQFRLAAQARAKPIKKKFFVWTFQSRYIWIPYQTKMINRSAALSLIRNIYPHGSGIPQ